MIDYIIVGAGIAGVVMAERIATQLNKKVLIIEKRNHIGGNCYDYKDENNILIHKYGPHLFHTNNKEVIEYLSNFTDWDIYNHEVLAYIDGKEVPIPFNINTLYEVFPTSKAKALEDGEVGMSSAISLFGESVKKLENSAQEYEVALEAIKKDLINAALDISKEVINIELGENASNIAKVLSSELIKELQSASKITLKVNPKDHGAISEQVGSLSHVEVISDSAITAGGVVAISDAGNKDSEISKRFEKVKQAAISE